MTEYVPYQILTDTALNASIDGLSTSITTETTARTVADAAEAVARAAAVSSEATIRATAITAEATARAAADTLKVAFTDLTAIGTPDPTGSWDLFGSGSLRVGSTGNNNAIIGMAINNNPPNTLAEPCGGTFYGKVPAGSSGNVAFGVFGRADLHDEGVVTNEVNSFNFKGAPTASLPVNRSICTTDVVPVCLTVAAGGTFGSSIGIEITQEGGTPQPFLTGIYIDAGAALTNGILIDANSSGPSAALIARAPPAGIPGTFQTIGTAVPANAALQVMNTSGTPKWYVRQSGDMLGASITPLADNVSFLGSTSFRYQSLWAVNGAIQTSDPRLKAEVTKLSTNAATALSIVSSIDPVTYKWKIGGYSVEPDTEEREVQATESQQQVVKRIEIRNGVPVLIQTTETVESLLYDDLAVMDEAGNPVMVPQVLAAAEYDGTRITKPAVYGADVPLTTQVPRMVTKQVPVEKQVPVAGRRIHWGFLASDIKAAFDAAGLDFGGYVKAEDGTESLRPDQLIPVLWRAIQELLARVDALSPPPAEAR